MASYSVFALIVSSLCWIFVDFLLWSVFALKTLDFWNIFVDFTLWTVFCFLRTNFSVFASFKPVASQLLLRASYYRVRHPQVAQGLSI